MVDRLTYRADGFIFEAVDGAMVPASEETTMTIRIGDKIKFRAATRCSDRVATRKVVALRSGGYQVAYNGCPEFLVRPHEVLTVVAATHDP